MGRKKSTSEAASVTHDPENLKTWRPEPAPERVADEDDELDNIFGDFPQNEACIELLRVNAQGGRPLFLEEMAPAIFSLAYVCKTYGGGRYIARGKYKDGSKVRMPFEIEGEPIIVKRRAPETNPHAPVTPGAAPAVERIIETARESGAGLEGVMVALVQQLAARGEDAEMKMLEKMRIYKELFSSGPQKEAPLDVALNMFTKGVELAGLQGGGGDGSNFWMLAIKELKDPLSKIVDTVQMAIGASHPRVVNPPMKPAPGAPVTATPTPAAEPNPEGSMIAEVKALLPRLINGAAKNADPTIYVDFLLDQFPASAYPELLKFLDMPDSLDKLAYLEPGIRFQQEWWISLRASLIEALQEELGHAPRTIQPLPPLDPATGDSADSPATA